MSRELTVAAARSLIGKKWRHRARGPMAYDCIGLIVYALEAGGIRVKDRTDYGREPWNDGLQAALRERWGDPVADYGPGDIALFRWVGKDPCHVGVLGDSRHGGLSIIHSHSQFHITEHDLRGAWEKLLVEVYSPWPR